jgi:hypothetical protein
VTIELPEGLPPAALEALQDIVALWQRGYTGPYRVDLKAGVPVSRRCTDYKRFGTRRTRKDSNDLL